MEAVYGLRVSDPPLVYVYSQLGCPDFGGSEHRAQESTPEPARGLSWRLFTEIAEVKIPLAAVYLQC